MSRRTTLCLLALLPLTLFAMLTARPADAVIFDQLDQQNGGASPDGTVALYARLYPAQIVTPGLSGQIRKIDVEIGPQSHSSLTVTLELRALAADGAPTGSLLATTSLLIEGEGVAWRTFTFATPASVTAGTQFAIVLTTSSSDFVAEANWYYDTYDGGPSWYFSEVTGVWTKAETTHYGFRTYIALIDSTAPEAVLRFNPATRALEVTGRDALSGPAINGPVPPATCTTQRSGQVCIYRVSDLAGNSVTLTVQISTTASRTSAVVQRIQYSGMAAVTPLSNEFSIESTSGAGAHRQCASVTSPPLAGQPSSSRRICAQYDGAATTMQYLTPVAPSTTLPGLAQLSVATDQGRLTIETP